MGYGRTQIASRHENSMTKRHFALEIILAIDPPPAEWLNQFTELSESCLAGAHMSDAFETVLRLYDRNEMPKSGGDEE